MTHLLLVLGLVVLVINLLSDEVQSKEEQQVPIFHPSFTIRKQGGVQFLFLREHSAPLRLHC